MADLITRMRLDSAEYDQKIKRAQQNLLAFEQQCRATGQSMNSMSKENLEYVRALGNMATVSKTARGRLNELTSAFTELSVQYKRLTDEEKNGDVGKAMAGSIDQLKSRIQQTKQDLADVSKELGNIEAKSGGLFGGDGLSGMLQVFGGNLLTKGFDALASGITNAWSESIELAKAGEGVRIAFERLNQPGLLDQLKEATHGTVSEVELMKQAVKFENFKLPLEDLAAYLAFAQQKAKDTGESVDYMVNSITTGLGRQSKQILDNLGISASELTRRMNEGADMTTAVADIIREEMGNAGEYIETAADRAARASADAQNKMEEFGRQAAPIAEEWSQTWNALSIGAMDFANTLLGPVAKSIRSMQTLLGTTLDDMRVQMFEYFDDISKQQQKAAEDKMRSGLSYPVITAPGGYVEVKDANTGEVIGGQHFDNLSDNNAIKAWKNTIVKTPRTRTPRSSATAAAKEKTEEQLNGEKITALTTEYITATNERQEAIRAEIKVLQERNAEIEKLKNAALGKVKPVDLDKLFPIGETPTYSKSIVEKMRDDINAELAAQNGLVDKTLLTAYMQTAIKNGIEGMDVDFTEIMRKMGEGMDIPNETWQALEDKINEKLKELKLDQIKLDFDTGKAEKAGDATAKSWSAAASAVQQVGGALKGIEDPAAQVAGTIAQAIANIALGYSQATAKSAKENGPWGWIAFAATGLATMISTISAIKSATAGSYAEGGIIPGNNHSDGLIAHVSSGELILNRAQQGVIASAITQNERGPQSFGSARVSGEQIYIALNNYLRRSGHGEMVTWG